MRVTRTTVYRLGLIWSVSCFALSANAAGGERPDDIRPPDLPELVLSHDVAGTPPSQNPVPIAEPRIDVPDLPAVVVSVPPVDPAADTATLALPDLPDAPVAITFNDRIRTALTEQIAKDLDDRTLRLPRKEREALAAFYEANGHQPLWVKDGAWTQGATIVTERLKTADEDGLDPTDYPVPVLASTKGITPADWAEAEIKLSTSAILYCPRCARWAGRPDPALESDHAEARLAERRGGSCPALPPRGIRGRRSPPTTRPTPATQPSRTGSPNCAPTTRRGRWCACLGALPCASGCATRGCRSSGRGSIWTRRKETRPPMTNASRARSRRSKRRKGFRRAAS